MNRNKLIIAIASVLLAGVGLGWGGAKLVEHKAEVAEEKAAEELVQQSVFLKKTAVVMAEYKQDLGERPTSVLKSNLDKEITKLSYTLVYYGTDGLQIDYQTFNTLKHIPAKGTLEDSFKLKMNKKKYVYAESTADKGEATPYRVEFQLLSFRTKDKTTGDE